MRLLLDTHIVLWTLGGIRELTLPVVRAIEDATEVYVSAVTFAEIGIKAATGKLTAPPDLRTRVLATGISILLLDADHGLAVAELPLHHRDPFDRLLIAQARAERLTLVTADPRMHAYDVAVIDAA